MDKKTNKNKKKRKPQKPLSTINSGSGYQVPSLSGSVGMDYTKLGPRSELSHVSKTQVMGVGNMGWEKSNTFQAAAGFHDMRVASHKPKPTDGSSVFHVNQPYVPTRENGQYGGPAVEDFRPSGHTGAAVRDFRPNHSPRPGEYTTVVHVSQPPTLEQQRLSQQTVTTTTPREPSNSSSARNAALALTPSDFNVSSSESLFEWLSDVEVEPAIRDTSPQYIQHATKLNTDEYVVDPLQYGTPVYPY